MSFRPSISKKSIALLRKKKKERSLAPAARDDSEEAEYVGADVFLRLHSQQLPRGDDAESRSLHGSAARNTNAQPTGLEWNEIAYDDAKHSFILRNFDLKLLGA